MDFLEFEKNINYTFKDKDLLKQALMHSSYANDKKLSKFQNNERLEFLGDAVLELSVSEYIYSKYLNKPEGELTRLRASIVCEPTLAECARAISLDKFILLGRGEERTGGRNRDSIISDAFEAVLGAVYLDGGFANAKEFVKAFVLCDLKEKQLFYDSKTILQEYVQKTYKVAVSYEVIKESGPDHAKVFEVNALIDDKVVGTGSGTSKKHAEQKASYNALKGLGVGL